MKKVLCLLCAVFLINFSALTYAQRGTLFNFEKIAGSEYYTYKLLPVEGVIEFSETVFPPFGEYMAEIFVKNNSGKTIDFNRVRFEAAGKNGKAYVLGLETVEVNTGGEKNSPLLKPEDIIIIHAHSPVRNDDVAGIYMQLSDGNIIHFVPYRDLNKYVKSPEQHLKNLLSGLMEIFKFKVR
ncbi:MAG: hypothetical protein HQ549_01120 [Candidatus Omnitrophica bacterium]|nr:hypothetical protein [Candidatus Omnitrophota bacterium]